MVFTRTCDATRLLALLLRNLGLRAIPISGHMSQVYIFSFILSFKSDPCDFALHTQFLLLFLI